MDESNNCTQISDINGLVGQKRKSCTEIEDTSELKKASQIDEKKTINNLRKNIRDVIDENQLDSTTLAAQREESERLARVNEQQKIIREYQRQTAVNRQVARTQSRVLSLLQNSNTFAKVTDYSASYSPGEATETGVSSSEPLKNLPSNDENKSSVTSSVEEKKLQKPSEIVTIDDSSDDDCILLSDEEEEIDEDTEDDSNNSGMHVKDIYNIPDEMGRVIINIGHPEGEEDIFLAPQIAKTIKPHQIGGVRFLFDNIIESTKRFKNSSGFGCILAHSMGLGKTLQVVCFCDIFMRHTPSKTILCVMPINTIQNWLSEFNMWTPRSSLDTGNIRPRTFEVFALNDQQKTLSARAKVVLRWAKEGGVLLIGYELFRLLALKLSPTRRRRGKTAAKNENSTAEQTNKNLMEEMYKALVKPGPDLIICDEGHRIKNAHAGISVALKQIRTRRRIVLTGYPLQNNLLEYWCMVDFVRPNYLGTRSEFCNMFERPIQNGQCIDSTPEDTKLMRYRAHVLHSLLMGFVQRRSHTVLQQTLPDKQEYVILTRMTSFQRQLYDTFMNDVVRTKTCPNPLKAFAVCCKIWNHPDVLYNFLKKRQADLDLEIDEVPPEEQIVPVENQYNEKPNSKNEHQLEKSKIIDETISNSNDETINSSISHDSTTNYEKSFHNRSGDFYNENYFQQYSSNINGYWPDSHTQYENACAPVSYSSKPNYVGTVKQTIGKKHSNEEMNSSSEIVDLDTKEIKTVSTNMNMRQNTFNDCEDIQTKKLSPTTTNDELNQNSLPLSSQKPKSDDIIDKEVIKSKNDDGIPYDWATDLMKNYEPGLFSNSPKMEIVFFILKESIEIGDRILLFSQSLLTLNLIEKFLETNYIPNTSTFWAKNSSYFRLDGSTTAQEREKLVNEFNSNSSIKLFLISTRAGSLGINLIGANRVIIFDASWNPCHDTQAVYRVYRYGQVKSCFIYRIVMDKCLEKKIYDRQIKKQGMSNRVVDECNPESHLSMKDVTNLCHDYENEKDEEIKPISQSNNVHNDTVIQKIVEQFEDLLSKEPFHHESLLVDRKEKKLSQAEKRLAHRGYEIEKKSISQKSFSPGKMQYRVIRSDGTYQTRPLVRPVQSAKTKNAVRTTRWIPAEVWQRQGMTAQEMTLPLDVVIPTNSSDKSSIILKAGQRVMVLKSTKGIYMQLESGKIIAIRTSSKSTESTSNQSNKGEVIDITSDADTALDTTQTQKKSKNANSVDNKLPNNSDKIINKPGKNDAVESSIKKYDYNKKNTTQNIIKNSEVLKTDEISEQMYSEDNKKTITLQNTANPNLQLVQSSNSTKDKSEDRKESLWKTPTKYPAVIEDNFDDSKKSLLKNVSKYQEAMSNLSYDYLSSNTYKGNSSQQNVKLNAPNETVEQLPSLDCFQDKNMIKQNVPGENKEAFIGSINNSECGTNGNSNFASNTTVRQIDKESSSSEKNNFKLNEAKSSGNEDCLQIPNFQQTLSAPYSNMDSLKNMDYSTFHQQPHQNVFKPTLYTPQFSTQRYPFSNMPSSSHNSVAQLTNSTNNLNAFIPGRDVHNYSSQYYDSYSSNNISDPCNYPLRYADYSTYGSYNHSPYQNNISHPSYRNSALPSALKPYHMTWPELVTHSSSGDNCNATFPTSNYANGSHPNHWPN